MPRVTRTREARRSIGHIWQYIASDNPDAAERWLLNINEKIEFLSKAPGVGKSRDELSPSLHSFAVGNYIVFYKVIPRGIEVIDVLHGSRNLRRLLKDRK